MSDATPAPPATDTPDGDRLSTGGSPRGSSRARLAITTLLAIGVVVLLAVLAARGVPGVPLNQSLIVGTAALTVTPGAAHAAVFPIDAPLGPGVSYAQVPEVTNATVSGSVLLVSCGASSSSAGCPGVTVLLLTSSELQSYLASGASPATWCYSGAGGCAAGSGGSFSADVTHTVTGNGLDLVVAEPAGSVPVTVSAWVSLFWTN